MPHSLDATTSTTTTTGTGFKKSHRISSSLSPTRLLSPTSGTSGTSEGAKFPRIDECAHFHYETVECGRVQLALLEEPPDGTRINGHADGEQSEKAHWINVRCKGKVWVIRRFAGQFETLDELLHECVYDRKFTQLRSLKRVTKISDKKVLHELLKKYVARLSVLPEDQMSCAPVLHWFDMDNKGTKIVAALRETADINIPAVAAAHAVRRYTAQSADELSLEVGDMVSIIDMSDSNWWRGKCSLQVGSFPAQCVRRISDAKQADEVPAAANLPSSPTLVNPPIFLNTSKTKPIVKKHGKFMDFLRSFLVTRPSKSRLKQSGILKERVFGCDLGEYLHNSGEEVPVVVRDCTEFVEEYGIVDGIYRISGVSSHVQNLRHEYDCERRPNLNRDPSGRGEQSLCDPHSVAGLCKLYFRELPNPLLTYQLYNRFADAINANEDERLLKIHDVIQQLPPPHYRTLKHLALHLQEMARQRDSTSMHCRNLAIVWAPNLLRSRDLEAGLAAFTEARVQSVVTEFLIANADLLFSEKLQNMQYDSSRGQRPPRPKSLMVLSAPKLISLEEARARSKAGGGFSKPSSENYSENVKQDNTRTNDVYRSRQFSTQPGYPHPHRDYVSSSFKVTPTSIVPLSSGSGENHSRLHKRRQSMDPKLTSNRYHHNFPSNSRQYSSQHSTGWKSKIGSFLKKGGSTTQTNDSAANEHSTDEKAQSLRRSRSDDSLLSGQSIKDGFEQDDDEEMKLKGKNRSSQTPPTLRHASGQKSPRPRGRIFMITGEKIEDPAEYDTSTPVLKHKTISDGTTTEEFADSRTPDSVPTPSLDTNPSNPFSGLDSDFPAVMGDSGLDFNPLQFSPTLSSSDSGIPEIPKNSTDSSHADIISSHPLTRENSFESTSPVSKEHTFSDDLPRKTIGNLEEIKTVIKRADEHTFVHRETYNRHTHKSELDTLYLNSKIEDILNANVKIKELVTMEDTENRMEAQSKNLAGNDGEERFQTVVDVLSSSETPLNSNSNNQSFKKLIKQKSGELNLKLAQSDDSFYWKSEEVDRLSEIGELPFEDKNRMPGVHTTSKKSPIPVDLPLNGSYSVQYACSQHNSKGRMRQSITATFVQDRPIVSNIRRPHSIRRSMDVPPTDLPCPVNSHNNKRGPTHHVRSTHDMARRHKAYAVLLSQRQKDPNRLHYRSLSTGDELDLELRPVPLPRRSSTKPVPMPRQRFQVASEKLSSREKLKSDQSHSCAISAPCTPSDGKLPKNYFLNLKPAIDKLVEDTTDQFDDASVESYTKHIQDISTEKNNPILNKKSLSKANSASAIVSPSDSVCASTVLSWV